MSDSERLLHISTSRKPPPTMSVCFQVLMCIMAFTQVAIGAAYLHDCPIQPYIPIYLMVVGGIALALILFSSLPCTANSGVLCMICRGFISLFGTCWFIIGNVWIYSIYEPSYNQTMSSTDTYCNKTLYLFAFWTTNLVYIMFGFSILCCCCLCILWCVNVDNMQDDSASNDNR